MAVVWRYLSKLKEWGIQGPIEEVRQGTEIMVETRTGKRIPVIVGRVLWTQDEGQAVALVRDVDYPVRQVKQKRGK